MAHNIKMVKTKARTFKQEMNAEGFSEEKAKKPTMHFDFGILPAGKDWEEGVRYRVVLEGTQIGSRSRDGKGGIELELDAVGGEKIEKKKGKRVLRKV